jgi:hypothetical protein
MPPAPTMGVALGAGVGGTGVLVGGPFVGMGVLVGGLYAGGCADVLMTVVPRIMSKKQMPARTNNL